MKTLHYLNKQITYIMLFLSSQSGSGFTLLVVFGFDLATNALGVQLFFSQRLAESMAGLGVTQVASFGISLLFSMFVSASLGLSIMQATLKNDKMSGAILSILSMVISIAGLAHVGIKVNSIDELKTYENIVTITMIIGLGITPPVVYHHNARLVVKLFGQTLEEFNSSSMEQMKKSFKASMKDLARLDEASTEHEVEKKMKRYNRRKPQFKKEDKGKKSLDELRQELGV